MKYLLLTAILLFPISLKKVELGLNLKKGETYSQAYTSKTMVTQNIYGTEQVIEMEIFANMDYRVKKVKKDRYDLAVSYTNLKMKMGQPTGDLIFSSDGKRDDAASRLFASMIDKEFDVEMLRNGRIVTIENLDKLFDTMMESFDDIPDAQKEQLMASLKGAYGEEAFKGNIEMITAIFPDQAVEVGESWKNTIDLESGMAATLANTFTLIEVNENEIRVDGISDFATKDQDAYTDINGMPTKYNLSGTMKASYALAPETNWVMEGVIEQDFSGDVEIKDNPRIPGGMTIPMKTETKMTVER
ncbi:MAG: DUF6263 family protein [Bacteroidota bacterium]